jgi:hypothetical protein
VLDASRVLNSYDARLLDDQHLKKQPSNSTIFSCKKTAFNLKKSTMFLIDIKNHHLSKNGLTKYTKKHEKRVHREFKKLLERFKIMTI